MQFIFRGSNCLSSACSRISLGWPPSPSRLQDSVYNLDPEKPEMMDDFTAAMLEKEGKDFSELETEIVEAPFVQVRVGS